MQFVDFAVALRMLNLPHPLFADDVDFHRVSWRPLDNEVMPRAPGIKAHENQQWYDRPGDFNFGLGQIFVGSIGGFGTAVLEHEIDNRDKNDEANNDAGANQPPIQVISLFG